MTALATPSACSRQGRLPAALGLASVVLLAAAFRWAHHWGPVADSIVAAWAATTVAALVVGIRRAPGPGRRAALLGLALAGVSVAALVVTGVAMAAGADPAAGCGGG
ncbi:MAG TPA: hypothetical protein VE824_04675 [Gaiellales bacterium]|nr:hypothetical protein [Gaiellales bacterium]